MRRAESSITSNAPGIAGTLMALVAIAATAAAVPVPAASPNQCRAAVMESQPLRAVAAVVAAACDLLGIERSHEGAASPMALDEVVQISPQPPVLKPAMDDQSPPLPAALREALLNLPPPICRFDSGKAQA